MAADEQSVNAGRSGHTAPERTTVIAGTTIARNGYGVLLRGPSGSGKSDLALRAICTPIIVPGEAAPSPFQLISDDQTVLTRRDDQILASAPAPLCGLLEVRGLGIVPFPSVAGLPLVLVVDLAAAGSGGELDRMPEYPGPSTSLLGRKIDLSRIAPFEAAAPLKVGLLLARSASVRTMDTS